MNRKQLLILLIVAVAIGGLGFYIYLGRSKAFTASDSSIGGKVLPDFPVNDVTHLRIVQNDSEVNVGVSNGVWVVEERWNYPADFGDVSGFLRKLNELKTVRSLQVGPSQFGRLALVNPTEPGESTNTATLVEFKDKAGQTIQSLLLGKEYVRESSEPSSSPFGGGDFPVGRYIAKLSDPGNVSVVSETLSEIEPRPADWLDKEFFKVEKLRSLSVTSTNDTEAWTVLRESETADWKLADAKEGEEFDSSKNYNIRNALSSPSFNDVVAPDASPEETGLDQPRIAKLETFDGFTYTVNLGKATTNDNYHLTVAVEADLSKERTPPEGESEEDKERLDKEFQENAAKLEEKLKKEKAFEKWTYLVSKWTVDPLLKPRTDLIAEKKEEAPADSALDTLPVPGLESEDPPAIDPDLLKDILQPRPNPPSPLDIPPLPEPVPLPPADPTPSSPPQPQADDPQPTGNPDEPEKE